MNNIIEINDITAPELDVYARTSEVQLLRYYEPEPGLFIAESPKVIERALPFAAKIREVTPTNAATRVGRSKSVVSRFDTHTIQIDPNQMIHSFFVNSFIGLFMFSFSCAAILIYNNNFRKNPQKNTP